MKKLQSDIRCIGSLRILDFEDIVTQKGNVWELTDVWGCLWKMDESKDFYYNQDTYPLEGYPSTEEGLKNYEMPDLIEAGMDIYNPVQFTAANMDLKGLKKDFGKDLVFWGGVVNTQTTLMTGHPEQASDEVKQIIEIMAPGGGFVFATVHNIQRDIPPENFWAMWDTLMEYGKYQ